MNQPSYDVVVFGATSFVGQILCQYLLDTFGTDGELKWAIAGRSAEKLGQVKQNLGPAGKALEEFFADASDPAALKSMCEQARVVVSTVGPYALYGEPLVKTCVETGTDYCDLTGEPQWIKRMFEKYQVQAQQTGARIVHCCGFDSIPSDLGVLFLQQQAHAKFGEHCNQVKLRVKAAKGAASGGTVASMLNAVKEATANPALRKELANPFSLCPANHGFKARQNNINGAQYDADFDSWIAPFVMEAINKRVVHRSNALSGNAYGDDFRYDEAMLSGKGMKGRLSGMAIAGGLGAFVLAAAIKPTRWVMEKYMLPKPGEGPSPEAQKAGFYDIRLFGKSPSGHEIRTKVTGDRDPGYGSTAKMLGQAAACLALDIAKQDKPGGFWTPATAMGDKLIPRLQAHSGLTFEVI